MLQVALDAHDKSLLTLLALVKLQITQRSRPYAVRALDSQRVHHALNVRVGCNLANRLVADRTIKQFFVRHGFEAVFAKHMAALGQTWIFAYVQTDRTLEALFFDLFRLNKKVQRVPLVHDVH